MLKSFFKDGVIYGITKAITSSSHLILLPIYTHYLEMEEYGIVDYLAILANVVIIIVSLEISQGFARYFAESNTEKEKSEYLSSSLWLSLSLFLIFSLLVIVFSKYLSLFLFDTLEYSHVVMVAALSFSGQGLLILVQNHLRYQLKAKLYAIVSIIYTTTLVLGISLLLVTYGGGVIHILYMQLIASIVAVAIGLHFSKSYYKFKVNTKKLMNILRFSLPLVLSSVGVFFALYMDRVAIKDILGFQDLAVYSAGYRIATMVSLILVGFQMALTPLIYRNYKNTNAPLEIDRVLRWFLTLILPVILFATLFSRELLQLFTTQDYVVAYVVVFPLTLSFLFFNVYLFAPGLWIAKKTIHIGIINIATAILNIFLNYTLIPYFGILGAAFATCLSAIVGLVGYIVIGQKLYVVPYKWKQISLSLVLTILVVYLTTYNYYFIKADASLLVISFIKMLILSMMSISFLLILIDKDEITYSLEYMHKLYKNIDWRI